MGYWTNCRRQAQISICPDSTRRRSRTLSAALPEVPDIEEPVVEDDFDVGKALDNIKEPETQRSDVLQIGPHRLVCGDATDPEDVARLMEGAKAALVVTDPPYNVAIESDSERLVADGRSSIMKTTCPQRKLRAFCMPSLNGIRRLWRRRPLSMSFTRLRTSASLRMP